MNITVRINAQTLGTVVLWGAAVVLLLADFFVPGERFGRVGLLCSAAAATWSIRGMVAQCRKVVCEVVSWERYRDEMDEAAAREQRDRIRSMN